jgi:predicted acetyltransferase
MSDSFEYRILTPDDDNRMSELKQLAFCIPISKFRSVDFDQSENYGLFDSGQLLGMVSMTPKNLLVGNCKINVGGIGTVATLPDARGKGVMRKLLNYSIEQMRQQNIPLSILWGDTQRYRHFGWETCGRKLHFRINGRSMKSYAPQTGFSIKPYNKQQHLEAIMAMHDAQTCRVERQRKDFEDYLNRESVMVWFASQGGKTAYLVQENEFIIESAGGFELVCQGLNYLLNNYERNTLIIQKMDYDSATTNELYRLSSWWSVEPLGMLKIINLEHTLRAFLPQLNKCRGIENQRISLKMLDSGEVVTLDFKNELVIEKSYYRECGVELSDTDMTRLIFYGNMIIGHPGLDSIIRSIFPLEIFWPRLDAV